MDRVKQVAASLVSSFNDDSGLPTWDELKEAPGTNYKCAWGLFDKVGGTQVDQVGTLNLLTPERVLNASRTEIRTGESISLNWGLENVKYPGFGRAPMKQKIIDLNQIGFCGHDDEVSFNTQCGSQVRQALVLKGSREEIMFADVCYVVGRITPCRSSRQ